MGVQAQPEYSSVEVETSPMLEPSSKIEALKSEPPVVYEILDDEIPGLHAGPEFTTLVSNPEVTSRISLKHSLIMKFRLLVKVVSQPWK